MEVNRNLYFKEIKRNRKSLIIWSIIIFGFTILVLSLFPYMKDLNKEMSVMMDKMPEALSKTLGLNSLTFNSILGMYNTYYGIYIIVLLSIYASSTGATIFSKEERNKSAEFLLTKPISRNTIFLSKILALFTLVFIAYLVQTSTAYILVATFGGPLVDWSVFVTMHLHGLGLILLFTCIGVFISMLLNPKRNFMGIMVGLVFGSYFINTIAKVAETVNWLGYISPFHYLDFEVTNPTYSLNVLQLGVMLFICALLLIASCRIFNKKDIYT